MKTFFREFIPSIVVALCLIGAVNVSISGEKAVKGWVLVTIIGDEESGYEVWPGASKILLHEDGSYRTEVECTTAKMELMTAYHGYVGSLNQGDSRHEVWNDLAPKTVVCIPVREILYSGLVE